MTPGICSENKWVYLGVDLIYNTLHRSPRNFLKMELVTQGFIRKKE